VGYWLRTGHRVFEEGSPMQIAVQHIHAGETLTRVK